MTATPPPVARGTIQLWSDLLCPFAHVAVHRLRQTHERLGLTGRVWLDHHVLPRELFNGPHPRRGTDSITAGNCHHHTSGCVLGGGVRASRR